MRIIEVSLEIIMTDLAHIHEVVVIQSYFRVNDIHGIKIDLVVHDISRALMTHFT